MAVLIPLRFTDIDAPLTAFSYTLPTLAYADEPDTLVEYDAMVSGMSGKTVNFSFTLNISDNVA